MGWNEPGSTSGHTQGLSKPVKGPMRALSPGPAQTKPLSTLLPGELLVRYVALLGGNRDESLHTNLLTLRINKRRKN